MNNTIADIPLDNLQRTLLKAVEPSGSAMVLVDVLHPNHPVVYCSKAFTELTGYLTEEVMGRNCKFLQNDDTNQEALLLLKNAISNGEKCEVILRNYKKDGTLFYNELFICPFFNAQNKLTHYIGLQHDLTNLKNEALLRHYANKQNLMTSLVELNSKKRKPNEALIGTTGNGRDYDTTIIEQDKKIASLKKDNKALEDFIGKLEAQIAERTSEMSSTVQKLVEFNLDLEQQVAQTKEAENKANANLAMLNGVVKNFPKGIIVIIDSNLKIQFVEGEVLSNKQLKNFDFEVGKHIEDIQCFTEKSKAYLKSNVKKTLKGEHLSYEITFNEDTFSVNTTPLYNRDKTVVHRVLLVYTNITEQKKLYEDIELALQKEHELNELKSRFIAMASHEFRTPLSAINISANLIEKLNTSNNIQKRADYVSRIKNNVQSLVVVLDDFLTISKIEEGKTKAKPTWFNIVTFIKSAIEELEDSKKEGQSITLINTTKNEDVLLDQKLLHYIVQNLLTNAMKYSSERSTVIVKISEKNQQLIVKVKDEGRGIPEKEQNQLFQRFFRAGNVTNIQGTGLGLNIVKQYTELLGGTIHFKSTQNVGTTFKVCFPNVFKTQKR